MSVPAHRDPSEPIMISCTGCYYREHHWSGLFDPAMAGKITRAFVRMTDCPIHSAAGISESSTAAPPRGTMTS